MIDNNNLQSALYLHQNSASFDAFDVFLDKITKIPFFYYYCRYVLFRNCCKLVKMANFGKKSTWDMDETPDEMRMRDMVTIDMIVIIVICFYKYCVFQLISSISVLCFVTGTSLYMSTSDAHNMDMNEEKSMILVYGASFYLGIVAMVLCVVDIVMMMVLKAVLKDNQ